MELTILVLKLIEIGKLSDENFKTLFWLFVQLSINLPHNFSKLETFPTKFKSFF
jgi:hypothetical protein